jgi:hypothetical protein
VVASVRILAAPALLLLLLSAGCLDAGPTEANAAAAIDACRAALPVERTYYFGPALSLQETPSPAGFAAGNSFTGGFLTNDLKEWLSAPVAAGAWIVGNVTLEFWARSTGTPAPLVIGGPPGEGYHFFNQFGSDRSFQPGYAVEYSEVLPAEGTVDHYTEQIEMPAGGFVLEAGDRVRVLLTDLAFDDGANGGGHQILFGGETPSRVTFSARCWPDLVWGGEEVLLDTAVSLPGNQGLLTGAVPASEANQATFPVTVPPGTTRLTVSLMQTDAQTTPKDDVDIQLLDRSGMPVYSIGSPYTDESGTLWLDNLQAHFPDGSLTVQVDSYSGVAYEGQLLVTRSIASAH